MHTDDVRDTAWGRLRATRWDPPGAASDLRAPSAAERTVRPGAAEQMFRAAAGVGPATRPLLVFYGLSWAGARLPQTASKIETDDGWQLGGHGIYSVPESLRGPLSDIRVRTDDARSKGSFVRLSELLDSPLWGKSPSVTLGILWDSLPENRLTPLDDRGEVAANAPFTLTKSALFIEEHPLVHVPVVFFPPWVVTSSQSRKSIADYIASFPGARGCDSYIQINGEPSFDSHLDGWGRAKHELAASGRTIWWPC